jgi:hypothetical protein
MRCERYGSRSRGGRLSSLDLWRASRGSYASGSTSLRFSRCRLQMCLALILQYGKLVFERLLIEFRRGLRAARLLTAGLPGSRRRRLLRTRHSSHSWCWS